MSMESCEVLTKSYPDVAIVVGAVDPTVKHRNGQSTIIPGVGDFFTRYMEGMDVMEAGEDEKKTGKGFWRSLLFWRK